MKKIALLLASFISIQCIADDGIKSASNNICIVSSEVETSILNEPLEVFDADDKMGWRFFSLKGCQIESIQLLEKYRLKNGNSYRTAFHEAQLRLSMGDTTNARPLIFLSLRPDILENSPFKWNEYVLGYLAFIDRDKDSLVFYMSKLEKGALDIRNQMNKRVLTKLFENFERPYSEIFPRK